VLLLVIYLFWPQRQPALAVQLLLLVGLAIFLDAGRRIEFANLSVSRRAYRLYDILAFFSFLLLYTVTTAPDVLPADSGEFQIVASLLGVAHPPGYPLYTLVGRLFTVLIPFGTAAYRLNLMSAFLAAWTLTLLGAATRRWLLRLGAVPAAALMGGFMAALTLGTTTTFWAQATVANIRMPTAFWAALGLYALARYADAIDRRQADRALALLLLALSLGIGHHPSLIFLGVFFFIYLVWLDPRLLVQPRRWSRPLLFALVALLPVIYLPLRAAAGAPLAPAGLDTLDGFVHHVTAQGFEGDMFAYANARDLPQRLMLLPTLFLFQFNWVLLAAAVLGVLVLAWRDRRLLTLTLGGLVLHSFVSITYRAPQTVEYMMPAYLPLAALVGVATAWLLSLFGLWAKRSIPTGGASVAGGVPSWRRSGDRSRRLYSFLLPLSALLAAIFLQAGLSNGLDHSPSFFTLARDRSTRAAMESMLQQAPPDAVVLADWRWVTPLWYLQWVEGQRTDVEVRYVYPVPGQEYSDTWQERIEAAIGERPLLLTHFYDLPEYTLEPLGRGFWIHRRPRRAASAAMSSLEAVFARGGEEGRVRLLGYQLDRLQASPGQMVELTLAWQAVEALATPGSFLVQLRTPEGQRLSQADRFLGTDYISGEVRFERMVLPLYPEILPGDYSLSLQVYSASEGGFETWSLQTNEGALPASGDTLNLATLALGPNPELPPTLHALDVPFADGPTLLGVDYDRSVPGTLRLYLHWRGPAQGGEQIRIEDGTARLPALADSAYQTAVIDLAGQVPEQLRLTLTGADGQIKALAGPWGWPLEEVRLPAPAPNARFVSLADEMALIGVSPTEGQTLAPGEQFIMNLTFLALKPLVHDNGVSVRLLDEVGQLRQMHDLQPALGAIPTLKWIRGSRITDPHPLSVPDDITGEIARATLVVYERFRGVPLPPLDGRMGSVPLGEWKILER